MTRFTLVAALLFSLPAFAGAPTYLTPAQVDLMQLLPPPPSNNAADLAQVLALQAARTPQRAEQAAVDATETVFTMFRPVLGERFAPPLAPLATALFDRLAETEDVLTEAPKTTYHRKRPFMVSDQVHPVVPLSKSGSYPSGHSTRVTIDGIVLAAMLPEHRAAIFARIDDYEQSRVIGGVHYPSDVRAGTLAGTAAAAVLFDTPSFEADFAAARRQLRAALGFAD